MAIIRELLGKTPQIGEGTFLAETATVIGDVVMGKPVSYTHLDVYKRQQCQ